MPFINVKTNCKLDESKIETVKAELGKAISAIPGKSEGWLMVGIDDDYKLFFKGTSAPACMVDVEIYGNANSSAMNNLTSKITDILNQNTGASPDRIYVCYKTTGDWGWNGNNF